MYELSIARSSEDVEAQSTLAPSSSNRSFVSDRGDDVEYRIVYPQPSYRQTRLNYSLPTSGTFVNTTNRLSDRLSRDHQRQQSLPIVDDIPRRIETWTSERNETESPISETEEIDTPVSVGSDTATEVSQNQCCCQHKAHFVTDLVSWQGADDPGHPMSWSRRRKWITTIALAMITFCSTFASSICSAAVDPTAHQFHSSSTMATLGVSFNVLGYAFGPTIFGPLSELYGRKNPLFAGYVLFVIMQIPTAVVHDLPSLFVCRFFVGLFGSAPLSIVPGAYADFLTSVDRGIAGSLFSGACFLGPTLGPIVGSTLVAHPSLGWRWTAWMTLILSVFFGVVAWFAYDESFAPVLLQRRAKRLRFSTKNWAIHAPTDEVEITAREIAVKYLAKPILMLTFEPILLLMTIYMSFNYGIIYLFLITYPYSFHVERHWSTGIDSLPMLAPIAGMVIALTINYIFVKTRFARKVREEGSAAPEERLLPMMIGAVALPAGLFWFGWTSSPESSFWPQVLGGIPAGTGLCLIFLEGMQYIVDVYLMYSNSAMAANCFVRSLVGAGSPLFGIVMFQRLGVNWASSVLGFIAIAMIPVPVLFYKFGARIRNVSRFTPKLAPGMAPPGAGGAHAGNARKATEKR